MAEVKLGLSLDELIKKNASATTRPFKGVRVGSGSRKGLLKNRQLGGGGARGTTGAAKAAVGGATAARGGAKVNQRVAAALGVQKAAVSKPRRNGKGSGAVVGSGGARAARPILADAGAAAPASFLDRDVPARAEPARRNAQKYVAAVLPQQNVAPQRAPANRGAGTASQAPTGRWTHDLFEEAVHDSLARQPSQAVGTKLRISNLDFNVSESDLLELFSVCGTLLKHAIFYDRTGRSKGTAEVVFARAADAQAALQRYNNVALDGKKMLIELAPQDAVVKTLSSGIRGATAMRDDGYRVPRSAGGGRGHAGGQGGRLKSGVVRNSRQLDQELNDYMED